MFFSKNLLKTKTFSKIAYIGKRPSPRAAFGFTQNGSQAYLFGGRCAAGRQNDLYQEGFEVSFTVNYSSGTKKLQPSGKLNLETMTWTEINCFIRPSQRSWTALTVVNDVLFIYGGLDSHDTSLEDLWRCDGRNWNRIYYQKSPLLASSMVDYGRVWHTAFYNSSDG